MVLIQSGLLAQERQGQFMVYPTQLGVSSGFNYHVCESSDGYLWIGTDNGLIKFDGKHYQRILAGPQSITDNYVIDVAEDTKGCIWIAGFWNGCSYFNPKTQVFRRFPKLGNSGSDMQQVNKILALPTGQIWLATGNMGLALYNVGMDSFEFFKPEALPFEDSLNSNKFTIQDIVQDPIQPEFLWLTNGDKIYKFNTCSYQFTFFPIINLNDFQKLYFTAIDHNNNDIIWLGSWARGMLKLHTKCGYLERINYFTSDGTVENGMVVLDLAQINDTIVWWACSSSGLIEYNIHTQKCKNISPRVQNDPTTSEIPEFHKITITKSGNIFIGISGYLLHWNPKFNRLGNKLVLAPKHLPYITYLSAIATDSNEIYYYLACAGPESLIRIHTTDQSQQSIPVIHPTSVSGLKEIQWMNSQQLIALGYDGLLYSMFQKDTVMKPIPGVSKHFESIGNIIVDSYQTLWIRKKKILYRVRFPDFSIIDSIALVNSPVPAKYSDWPIYFYQIAIDPLNRLWLGSNQGLFMVNPQRRTSIQIAPGTALGKWMRHDLIRSFFIDPEGNLWIGYNGDGLQRMDSKYFKEDKRLNAVILPSQTINDIAMTSKGRLLLATRGGLVEIDTTNYNWQLFGIEDGLSNNNIESGLFVTSNGKVFVPQLNSYHLFDEHSLNIDHDYLKINITEFMINDHPLNLSLFIKKMPEIKLRYKENNLRIKFAAMHKEFPWRTKYSYRLFTKNDTATWYPLDDPNIQFSALQPGDYTLQFSALGAGHVINWPKQILISIAPPFWKSWWFISLLNALALSFIYGLYRFRLQQIRKPLEIRTLISRNLHDDIGSSLSSIQILNELTRRNISNPEKATSFLDKSKEDLQRISESLSDIVWNVSPKYDDLNNLFIRMRRYAADMLEGKQINYDLHFPENASKIKLKMEFRREFYLIFKESLHNMVKYSNATSASIDLEIKEGFIVFMVADNGIGFDIHNKRMGHGIENMKHRAQKCNGKLEIISELNKGTTVLCKIPIQ